jgi:hypothetical protein
VGKPHSAIDETIRQLEADVVAHKRIARQNRDQASTKLRLADELRAFCKANGIPVRQERRDE